MSSTRRQFLRDSAIATGAAITLRSRLALGLPAIDVKVIPPLSVFEYAQVQLLDGLLREQFDHNHDLFLHLDEDALLKPFRQRQGMSAPGPDMGGWYDDADDFTPPENFHAFIPGHTFGQYLSGLARAYAVGCTRYRPPGPGHAGGSSNNRAWRHCARASYGMRSPRHSSHTARAPAAATVLRADA